jgi:hypothetical protein
MTYVCNTCGQVHEGLPDIGFQYPDYYYGIPESERTARTQSDPDHCAIDSEYFFIRGVILIPVHDQVNEFGLGVWVSQKQENFETYIKNNDTADIGPFFGWLSNHLPFYEQETLLLKTMVHFQGNGQRPVVDLEPGDHKLYRDYVNGISLHEAWQMAHWSD